MAFSPILDWCQTAQGAPREARSAQLDPQRCRPWRMPDTADGVHPAPGPVPREPEVPIRTGRPAVSLGAVCRRNGVIDALVPLDGVVAPPPPPMLSTADWLGSDQRCIHGRNPLAADSQAWLWTDRCTLSTDSFGVPPVAVSAPRVKTCL